MKRNIIALEDIKKRISDLKGDSVNMEINKGRNKIDTFTAVIIKVYPSVFTVETFPQSQQLNQKQSIREKMHTSQSKQQNQRKKPHQNRLQSQISSKTFSYFDVLCGDVKITPVLEAEL